MGLRIGVRVVGFFYFVLNSPPLTLDVTWSGFYFHGKNIRRQCQINTLKYRNLILFLGDKLFCKRRICRNNSLQLTLISEAVAWKLFSMTAFAQDFPNSYVGYKHFVTRRINLIHYILNKFKIEFKELFFFALLYRNISQLLFKDFCQSLQNNGKPKSA